jgi:hypothetical protein
MPSWGANTASWSGVVVTAAEFSAAGLRFALTSALSQGTFIAVHNGIFDEKQRGASFAARRCSVFGWRKGIAGVSVIRIKISTVKKEIAGFAAVPGFVNALYKMFAHPR